MRRFLSDSIAMITFSTVVAMVIEVLISGMTLGQSVHTRLIAVPVNLATGWLYGVFRDWLFQLTNTNPATASWTKKTILDTSAFTVFQMPLYAGILYVSGANLQQILTACGVATLSVAPLGRPYGIFLEYVRRIFQVS